MVSQPLRVCNALGTLWKYSAALKVQVGLYNGILCVPVGSECPSSHIGVDKLYRIAWLPLLQGVTQQTRSYFYRFAVN